VQRAQARHLYRERRPVAGLAPVVSALWVQRAPAGPTPLLHRSVPNGSVELVCELGALPRVAGPGTRSRIAALPAGAVVVGARLRPEAGSALLPVPAAELLDAVLPADALWGSAAAALGEGLSAAASPEAALVLLERHLLERLRAGDGPDPLVAEAVRRLGPWRREEVGALARSLHLSERQLRRRCHAAVGLAPKALQRTLRFQGLLALVQADLARGREPGEGAVAALAAAAGYADQPHLTRECVRLTGQSPRRFLRQTARQCGTGHDHAASYEPLLRAARPPR